MQTRSRRTPVVRRLSTVLAGLLLAAGTGLTPPAAAHDDPDDPTHSRASHFAQVALARGEAEVGEPMSLAVLPDRSVLHTSRDGTLRLTGPAGDTRVAGSLPVYSHDEEGLQGVAVDPDFATNRFVFLYYAPRLSTPAGDAPATGSAADFAPWEGVNRLSRFVLRTDGTLDPASERKVLDVPATRGMCCHVGGDLDFDAAGNLYLSTGDDTNPFASDGYTPIDERPSRNPAYDAQRTAGNSNDLRGKVLRIKVNADGSYGIPAGNLFAPNTPRTRPEIYAMGFRNPFRMSVDRSTGAVLLGDYGPDAGTASPARGPAGQVEFNRITRAGNFGWPYCTGRNDPYTAYDFATGGSGRPFDCAAPRNTSPHNTGLTELPPAQPAWLPYDGGSVPEFGTGSESPMAGPVYRYDPASTSAVKFPREYDGDFFAGEFGRRWIKRIGQAPDGSVRSIEPFPWQGTQVMDMAFGPDGALYVLDYGTGYFGGDANSALYRIEYRSDALPPAARVSADRTSGTAPLTVAFSSAGSGDPGGGPLAYAWDFGDGAGSTAADPSHTFAANGRYQVRLVVTGPSGLTASAGATVTVGNTAPTVTLELPADGSVIDPGEAVPYRVTVSDPEDGAIDCSRVRVSFILGHDSHGHPQTSATGCSGTVQTIADGEHDPNANVFGVWDAEYTDGGAPGQPPLTGRDQAISQPTHRQAEHWSGSSGITVYAHDAAHGGRTVGDVHHGDWISLAPYRLSDVASLTVRASSAGAGGTVEVRTGSPDGPLLGSAAVPVTGSWESFREIEVPLRNGPAGTTALYLVFTGGAGALFDVDDFVAHRSPPAGPVHGPAGKCLDVADAATADGTRIQLYTCNGTGAQHWTPGPDGTVRALGKCLDVSGAGTVDGTRIHLWGCNGTEAQTWVRTAAGELRNPRSDKCLDVTWGNTGDGTPVQLWTCNGTAAQRWTFPA
ncbi:PQQ-dependent sugar dehydrogenase [Kitasatospora sp. NPDC054939]